MGLKHVSFQSDNHDEILADGLNLLRNPTIENDLQLLIDVLPERVKAALISMDLLELIEVVMDLGRLPEARFSDGTIVMLSQDQITSEELDLVVSRVGDFADDNRAGIPRTLHRISAMRNRKGVVVGLTCRVGKVVTGTIESIRDLVESGKSILLLGRPGSGKTTKLREIAKLLADQAKKRVVIVDTSNEIAGDGDIPHPAVGHARRMQVSHSNRQKEVMIEAVENHTPEVIVVDEIGTEDEALAARTIAERGVILIATAHGSTLESVIKNPMLSDLIGGIQAVTLGDDEAKRRSSQKTVLEREKKPTFDIAVEIRDRNTLAIYPDVAEAVDHLLRGWSIFPEVRKVDSQTGAMKVLQSDVKTLAELAPQALNTLDSKVKPVHSISDLTQALPGGRVGEEEFRVFIYSISKTLIERILERLHLKHIRVTSHLHDADAIIALRGTARPGSKIMQLAEDYEIPVFIAKTNTMPQIQRALREAMNKEGSNNLLSERWSEPSKLDEIGLNELEAGEPGNETDTALKEAEEAVNTVLSKSIPVELSPRRSYIRRLQHELVEKHNLFSCSVGNEPNRRLKIVPSAAPKKNDV